jgi:predicted dehydrogenase
MSVTRIGVAGLGSIGSRHARLLAAMDGIEVHGFDSHGVPAGDRGGLTSLASSLDDLMTRAPDGLVVATPDAVHVEQAAAALHAGVPVLIEKPLSNDLVSARAVAELAAATGVPAMVGYVLRHHSTMGRFRSAIEQGAIGQPLSFHATLSASETLVVARSRFDDAVRFQLVYDYSHEWDYLQWLFGPIERCAATARIDGPAEPTQIVNIIEALFELDGGMTGSAHLDYVGTGSRRCRVIGAEGVAELDIGAGSVKILRDGLDERVDAEPEERDAAFRRQLEHFVSVVRGEADPMVTLNDGVRAIAVADAVVQACTERCWVDVEPTAQTAVQPPSTIKLTPLT